MAKAILNLLAGYPWTIVRVERRKTYMNALEEASTLGRINSFARFIREEVQVDWDKKSTRTRPLK